MKGPFYQKSQIFRPLLLFYPKRTGRLSPPAQYFYGYLFLVGRGYDLAVAVSSSALSVIPGSKIGKITGREMVATRSAGS